jgi:hypothetical protein
MFNDDKSVHRLVQFIKDQNKLTWKAFAELLVERMADRNPSLHLSPANVRNFATGNSSAWWFWGEIGEIGLEMWLQARGDCDGHDCKQIDLFYSQLFADDLMQVYGYLYNRKALTKDTLELIPSLKNVIANADALMNSIINHWERFYSISLPSV